MTASNLQSEIAFRLSIGCRRATVAEMAREFMALGYRLDRSMDCRSQARYLDGPRAGHSHPCVTTGVKEADTGRSAFHYQARRDANFRAMQELRGKVFAITRGAILEA